MINERRAFGERLRRQREKQHITLDQIAASTKVAASLFAGLEKGDCSRWPGGMYNRAFIRGYAVAIRLDPDDVAAEFAEYYTASTEAPAVHGPAVPGSAAQRERPFALRLKLEVEPEELRRRVARRIVLAAARRARRRSDCGCRRICQWNRVLVRTRDLQYRVPGRRPPAFRTLSGRAAARARTSPDSAAFGRRTTGRGAGRGNGKHGRLTTVAGREVSRQWGRLWGCFRSERAFA